MGGYAAEADLVLELIFGARTRITIEDGKISNEKDKSFLGGLWYWIEEIGRIYREMGIDGVVVFLRLKYIVWLLLLRKVLAWARTRFWLEDAQESPGF